MGSLPETLALRRLSFWRAAWRVRNFASKGPGYALPYLRWRIRTLGRTVTEALPSRGVPAQMYTRGEPNISASYFRTREHPRFHFDDGWGPVALVKPDTRMETIARAQGICNHVFRFRGHEIRMDRIDWDCCPRGNLDWTRDLNRHFYFITLGMAHRYTGDPAFAREFASLAKHWLASNGPRSAAWSSPFEVAARINAWIWSFFLFRHEETFEDTDLLAFLEGLYRQAHYLDANLEYHIPTNHLILEAKTLALCALLFPEWRESIGWFRKGMSVLCGEFQKQVCPDGVHGERSILYHKIITGEISELVWLLYRMGRKIPLRLLETLGKMLEFEMYITRPDGTFPLFSDSAAADGYLRFSAPAVGAIILDYPALAMGHVEPSESTVWMLGEEGMARRRAMVTRTEPLDSRGFRDGGYFVMRGNLPGSDFYLALDCGPFGLPLVPDHGHADALSFELFAGGQPLIIDSGVHGYHLGEKWRAYFRGTRAHNTLLVDGENQSVIDGVRHVYRPARASLLAWLPGRHFDWADGSHNGYARLPGPITHRRQLLFVKDQYWILADWALGEGRHRYETLFHLTPWSNPALDASGVRTQSAVAPGLAILPVYPSETDAAVIFGETEPVQGWVSFESGEAVPAPAVSYRRVAEAPFRFAGVLFPFYQEDELPIVQGYAWPGSGRGLAVAAGLSFRDWTDYLMLSVDPQAVPSTVPLRTDGTAGFLRWENGGGRLSRAFLVEGTKLVYRNVPVVRASGRVESLELVCHHEYLYIWSKSREDLSLNVLTATTDRIMVNGLEIGFTREGPFINLALSAM